MPKLMTLDKESKKKKLIEKLNLTVLNIPFFV